VLELLSASGFVLSKLDRIARRRSQAVIKGARGRVPHVDRISWSVMSLADTD
jgi:hypothetical protein